MYNGICIILGVVEMHCTGKSIEFSWEGGLHKVSAAGLGACEYVIENGGSPYRH